MNRALNMVLLAGFLVGLIGLVFQGCMTLDNSNDNSFTALSSTTSSTGTLQTTINGTVEFPANSIAAELSGLILFKNLRVYINNGFFGFVTESGTFSFPNVPGASEYKVEIKNSELVTLLVSIDSSTFHAINAKTTARALILERGRFLSQSFSLSLIKETSNEFLALVSQIEALLKSPNAAKDALNSGLQSILNFPGLITVAQETALKVLNGTTTTGAATSTNTTTNIVATSTPLIPTAQLLINDGAATTTQRVVTGSLVNINGLDITSMSIAGGGFQTFSRSFPHTLDTGDGVKTVSVFLKDKAGNQSAAITDSIFLKNDFTVNFISLASGASFVSLKPTLQFTMSQNISTATFNDNTVFLSPPASTSVSASGNLITLSLSSPLKPLTTYSWVISGSVKNDFEDVSPPGTYTQSFTTGNPMPYAGKSYGMFVKSDGTVWGTGLNSSNQLGNGNSTNIKTPAQSSSFASITHLSLGEAHGLALNSAGEVFGWGANESGQLGDGGTSSSANPKKLSIAGQAASISAGGKHSLVALKDGSLIAFGANDQGQLGNGAGGPSASSTTPVAIFSPGSNIAAISAGKDHSVALDSFENGFTWGGNTSGQLGIGSFASSTIPVNIGSLTTATALGGGDDGSYLLFSSGVLLGAGDNQFGQLGNVLANSSSTSPITSFGGGSLVTQISISPSGKTLIARKSDGTVAGFGKNDVGQLGIGSSTGVLTPTAVASLSSILGVSSGNNFSFALNESGEIFSFGNNTDGQLGDSTNTQQEFPVKISNFTLF